MLEAVIEFAGYAAMVAAYLAKWFLIALLAIAFTK
jgi:hypothetical protein